MALPPASTTATSASSGPTTDLGHVGHGPASHGVDRQTSRDPGPHLRRSCPSIAYPSPTSWAAHPVAGTRIPVDALARVVAGRTAEEIVAEYPSSPSAMCIKPSTMWRSTRSGRPDPSRRRRGPSPTPRAHSADRPKSGPDHPIPITASSSTTSPHLSTAGEPSAAADARSTSSPPADTSVIAPPHMGDEVDGSRNRGRPWRVMGGHERLRAAAGRLVHGPRWTRRVTSARRGQSGRR